MTEIGQRWRFFDQAAVVHLPQCEAVGAEAMNGDGLPIGDAGASDAIVAYALAMRPLYDSLKRVIGQVGGLLILAETTGKAETIDLPSLAHAEDALRNVREQLATLPVPAGPAVHRERVEAACRLAAIAIDALRKSATRAMELAPALDALSRSYQLLQSASDSRFGLMMVDFRHACCTCGAIGQA
jgi:hypothetical protein